MIRAALIGASASALLVASTQARPQNGPGVSGAPPIVTTWDDVLARATRPRAPRLDRRDPPARHPLLAAREYENPDEIVAARLRIAAFEEEARAAIAAGREPPRFWIPYDPVRDQWDASVPRPGMPALVGGLLQRARAQAAGADPAGPAPARLRVAPRPVGPQPDPTGGADAPTIHNDWMGVSDTSRPSDSICAVGPAHVGIMVNKELAFYTKDGTLARGPVDFEDWWPGAPVVGDLFDPKIVYDAAEGHWIMLALNGRRDDPETYYAISVSQTSNPEAGWWTWYFRSDVNGAAATDFWADFPGLGYDSGDSSSSLSTGGGVYLTSNQYLYNAGTGTSAFQYAKLRVLRKYQLYTGSGAINWWDFWNHENVDGTKVFTWKPAATYSSTGASPSEYLLNTRSGGETWVTKYRVTNPLASGPTLTGPTQINTNAYTNPPAAKQLGGGTTQLIDTGDCRTQDVQYRHGDLYMACGDARDWGTPANVEATIHYFRIVATTNVVTWDNDYGADDLYYSYPNIQADDNEEATVILSRSGASEYAGIRVTGRQAANTALQGSALIKAGEATYNPTTDVTERWGDYNGIGFDCAGDMTGAWSMSQYAPSSSTWETWIGGTSFGQPNVVHIPDGSSSGFTSGERYFTWEVRNGDWSGCSIYNQIGGDNDLQASRNCPFTSPYQSSTFGVDVRDFIVANGTQYGNEFHHAHVYNFAGSDSYRFEARNQSIDVAVGTTANGDFASAELMDLYECALTSGKDYAAVVDITSGNIDLDLWAFRGSRDNGRRADNDGTSQTTGVGIDETLVFTAAESSTYGFAVISEAFNAGEYTFRIWLKPLIAGIPSANGCGAYTGPTPTLTEGTTPVVWTLEAGPAGMTINSTTGVVSWAAPTAGVHLVRIRATNPAGFDEEAWNLTIPVAPGTPANVAASDGTFCGKVRVTWNAVAGATEYTIWRNTVNNSATAAQIATDPGSPYDDTSAVLGTTYFYWVRASNGCAQSPFSASNSGFAGYNPDCDNNGALNVNDYICFQTKFALGDPYADCDGNGVRNVNDYICFQTRFALGCP